MKKAYVCRNPAKTYGEQRWDNDVAGAVLSTDYKSPPLLLIVYEEDDSNKHNIGRMLQDDIHEAWKTLLGELPGKA